MYLTQASHSKGHSGCIRLLLIISLTIPLILAIPFLIAVQANNNNSNIPQVIRPYLGIITFTILGLSAFGLAYLALRIGYCPFMWYRKPKGEEFKTSFKAAMIILLTAALATTILRHFLIVEYWINTYIGLGLGGISIILVVARTQSVISAFIIHFINNIISVVNGSSNIASVVDLVSSTVFSPLAEEMMKLSFALAMGIFLSYFVTPKVKESVLIVTLAYIPATILWLLSHCIRYPTPFLHC